MADIDIIRGQGQWSDLGLIIDAPAAVYTARVNGSFNELDYSIAYDGGAGTIGNCLPDMTILIGTAAGLGDRAVARLRKAPAAGTFYLGVDDSLINIQNDDYITVLDVFEPFVKNPRSTLMDADVGYSNQHTVFDPVPVLKGTTAVIEAGGTVHFDASGSWVPGSTISAYSWTFTGASSTTGLATATPTATYNTSGRYRVALTLTADNGQTWTSYYYVYVLGANLAATENFSIDGEPTGAADAGWKFRINLFARPTIRKNAMVTLVALHEQYDTTAASYGPVVDRENILACGWIVGETIRRTPMQDTVEFDVAGGIAYLKCLHAMATGLQDTNMPAEEAGADDYMPPAWSQVTGLTTEIVLYHLARWRSTITRCMSFYVEQFGWAVPKAALSDSLGQQLQVAASVTRLEVRSDRLGRLFAERDAQNVPIDERDDIPVIFDLQDQDWQEELVIVPRQAGDVASVALEGVIFAPSQRAMVQVGSRAPGNAPMRFGSPADESELVFPDQATCDELAGLRAGALNAPYENLDGEMANNNRLMDVAPRQYITTTVDGVSLHWIPRRVSWRLGKGTGFLHTALELELGLECAQLGSTPILYPGVNEPEEPPEEPPATPPPPEWPTEPPEPPAANGSAVVATVSLVKTSGNFLDASPTWSSELS